MKYNFNGTMVECTVAEFLQLQAGKAQAGKQAKVSAPKKVSYTKANGQVIQCSPKQAALYESKKADYTPEERAAYGAQKRAEWEQARASFKPSKDLKKFIKEHPTCTREEAKAHGFVGTKADLKELKASLR